jgi:hypothetical protein
MSIRTPLFVIASRLSRRSAPAAAQQTVSEVLSFPLTNRSIPTGDFVQDASAAAATRDTFSTFLAVELAALPVASSASAFTYRLDRNLGTVIRSSDSFGPFLVERSLTSGLLRGSLALSYQAASFDTIDGRSLTDGTLVATASRLRAEAQPFDVEALSLNLHTKTMTIVGQPRCHGPIGHRRRSAFRVAIAERPPCGHLPGDRTRAGHRVRLGIGTRATS